MHSTLHPVSDLASFSFYKVCENSVMDIRILRHHEENLNFTECLFTLLMRLAAPLCGNRKRNTQNAFNIRPSSLSSTFFYSIWSSLMSLKLPRRQLRLKSRDWLLSLLNDDKAKLSPASDNRIHSSICDPAAPSLGVQVWTWRPSRPCFARPHHCHHESDSIPAWIPGFILDWLDSNRGTALR